jgi:hypothetical protein
MEYTPSSSPVRDGAVKNEAPTSGVSWPAIIAGAVATAALSLALLALGTGVGFSVASPWINPSQAATRLGWTAIVWIVLMQIVASSVGGYLAGRLRTRWVNVHTHEVYFRDTAHGFLAWSLSLVLTAGLLTSAASAMSGDLVTPSIRTDVAANRADVIAGSDSSGRGDDATTVSTEVADRRKAIAHSLYWTFVALLCGAFCASVAATIGGKERDRMAIA